MEKMYRLEFNEKQQCFHYASEIDTPDTFGWFTVFDYCTEEEFIVFECFLKRGFEEKYSKEYIFKSKSELQVFWGKLLEKKIGINKF